MKTKIYIYIYIYTYIHNTYIHIHTRTHVYLYIKRLVSTRILLQYFQFRDKYSCDISRYIYNLLQYFKIVMHLSHISLETPNDILWICKVPQNPVWETLIYTNLNEIRSVFTHCFLYFLTLFFRNTTCFGYHQPSSGVSNPKLRHLLNSGLLTPDDGWWQPKHVVFMKNKVRKYKKQCVKTDLISFKLSIHTRGWREWKSIRI
jgi:hypothetical protein